jgi:hypothetical protein
LQKESRVAVTCYPATVMRAADVRIATTESLYTHTHQSQSRRATQTLLTAPRNAKMANPVVCTNATCRQRVGGVSPRPIRRSNKWRLTKWSQRQGVPPRTRGLSPVSARWQASKASRTMQRQGAPPRTRGLSPVGARWRASKTSHTLCIRVITTRPVRRSNKWRLSQRSPSKRVSRESPQPSRASPS